MIVACSVTLFVISLSCYYLYGADFIHIVSLSSLDAIILFFLRMVTHRRCNQGVAFCVACNGIVAFLRCMPHVVVASRIARFEDPALEIIYIQVCLR